MQKIVSWWAGIFRRMQRQSRAVILVFADVLSISASYFAALMLRFDFIYSNIPSEYLEGYIRSLPYWLIVTVVTFYILRLYHSVWSFAGVSELVRMVAAYLILIPFYVGGGLVMDITMPRSFYFIGYIVSFCLTTGVRFSYRLIRAYLERIRQGAEKVQKEHVMIVFVHVFPSFSEYSMPPFLFSIRVRSVTLTSSLSALSPQTPRATCPLSVTVFFSR